MHRIYYWNINFHILVLNIMHYSRMVSYMFKIAHSLLFSHSFLIFDIFRLIKRVLVLFLLTFKFTYLLLLCIVLFFTLTFSIFFVIAVIFVFRQIFFLETILTIGGWWWLLGCSLKFHHLILFAICWRHYVFWQF